MVYLNGTQVPGFDIDLFRTTLNDGVNSIEQFASTLTPREKVILSIGLVASHIEESVANGDWTRARAHIERLTKQLELLM